MYAEHYENNQTMHSDLFFVNQMIFLTSYFHPLANVCIDVLPNKEYESISTGLLIHHSRMRALGLKVKYLEFDSEASIDNKEQLFDDVGLKQYNLPSGMHSGRVEKSIRHDKDVTRSILSSLQKKPIPRSLYPSLMKFVEHAVNWELKGGVREDDTPPNEILYKRKANAKDLAHKFGDYVICHAPTKPNYSDVDVSRIEDTIALYPNSNGFWHYLKLDTWKIVRRDNGKTQLKWSDAVFKRMNAKKKAEEEARKKLIREALARKLKDKKLTKKQQELVDIATANNANIFRHAGQDENLDEPQKQDNVADDTTTSEMKAAIDKVDEEISKEVDQTEDDSRWKNIIADLEKNILDETGLDDMNSVLKYAKTKIQGTQTQHSTSTAQKQSDTQQQEVVEEMLIPEEENEDEDLDHDNAINPSTKRQRIAEPPVPIHQEIWNEPTEDDGSRTGIDVADFSDILPNTKVNVKGDKATKDRVMERMKREVELLTAKIIENDKLDEEIELRKSPRIQARRARGSHVKVAANATKKLKEVQDKLNEIRKKLPPGARIPDILPTGNLNIPKAQELFGGLATESVLEELIAIIELQVFEGRYQHLLTKEERLRILRTHLFLKVKTDGEGCFNRLKARLVADGSIEMKSSFQASTLYSPTVALQSVLLMLAIAAWQKLHMVVLDVSTAYLEVDQQDDVTIFIRLDKHLAKILVSKYPEYRKFICPRTQTFVGELKKRLYGTINAAAGLYDKMKRTLMDMGYRPNCKDECAFIKEVDGVKIYCCCYVDDLAWYCSDKGLLEKELKQFQKTFPKVKIQRGNTIQYLGMTIHHNRDGKIELDMKSYIEKAVRLWNSWTSDEISKSSRQYESPSDTNLFDVQLNSKFLDSHQRDQFHTMVGTLQFLSRRARIDITTVVAFLATRVQAPTQQDWNKLRRLMMFLNHTIDRKLEISPKGLYGEIFVDASYGTAKEYKSQSGFNCTLGGASYVAKSTRQKITAKSSTEAELLALSEAIGLAMWAEQWLDEFEFYDIPTMIWEDNKSVITLCHNPSNAISEGSRHINIKYFQVKDLLKRCNNPWTMKYLDTTLMIADQLTKGTPVHVFRQLSTKLMESHSEVHEQQLQL